MPRRFDRNRSRHKAAPTKSEDRQTISAVSGDKKARCGHRAGVKRIRKSRGYFLRACTSPKAFFTFCTLGKEMPTTLAISAPVLPASASFFTWARVSSVMTARLRRFLPGPPAREPGGRPRRRGPRRPPAAASTASAKASALSKPYCLGRFARARLRSSATAISRAAALCFSAFNSLILSVIMDSPS
jgi:hypothetical protein